jgi:hypothetical protein
MFLIVGEKYHFYMAKKTWLDTTDQEVASGEAEV